MTKPVVWDQDPECGHEVECPYQTHYCTYARVPRLLSLQCPESPDEALLITSLQWHELWLKVLVTDLRAALQADAATFEPTKLLRRGIAVFRLFDLHADFAETVILREAGLAKGVRRPSAEAGQLRQLAGLASELTRLERLSPPELAEAASEYRVHLEEFRARYRGFLKSALVRGRPGTPTYAEWLRLPELLALQNGPKAAWHEPEQPPAALMEPEGVSPDENLFIVVHQCFEIWFKVMLNHLDRTAAALTAGDVPLATRLVRRLVLLQQWLVQQIRMPATMLPLDFMRFRSQQKEEDGRVLVTGLSPASGTESYQFREVEILCGLRDDSAFRGYLAGASAECGVRSAKCPAATADHQPPTADCRPPTAGCTASTGALPVRLLTPRQAERLREPTLMEAFQQVVRERGLHRLDDLFTPADVPNPHADLAGLADLLLDFDEFFRQWRLAHVSMVEKMIGARSGTGYLGPEYLQETAGLGIQKENRVLADHQVRPHFFEELWAVRSRLGQ